jgi:RNA polymerase sigma-70 factor, ECF subfamily
LLQFYSGDRFLSTLVHDAGQDIALLTRVKGSDPDAFGELFRKYQPLVYRQVFFRVRDADTSHEIVQETFVRIWEHRSSLKPHLPFLALTLSVSRNIVRDLARHQSTHERLAREIPAPSLSEGDDPAEALQLRMLEQRILEILNNRLGERCRTIFLLSRYEGKSHQEIAGLLGISAKTVENQIARALKALKRGLGRG